MLQGQFLPAATMPLRASPQQKRRNRVVLAVTILLAAAGAAFLYSPLRIKSAAAEPGPGNAHGLRSAGTAGVSVKASSIVLPSTESADAAAADLAAAEEAAAEELAATEEAAAADLAAAEAAAAAEVAAAEEQAAALAAVGAVTEEEVAAAEAAAPRPEPTPASLAACESFACLRENQVPGAKYPFPHFIIIGFAKSATTSIADYLRYHPDVSYPTKKVRATRGRKRLAPCPALSSVHAVTRESGRHRLLRARRTPPSTGAALL